MERLHLGATAARVQHYKKRSERMMEILKAESSYFISQPGIIVAFSVLNNILSAVWDHEMDKFIILNLLISPYLNSLI